MSMLVELPASGAFLLAIDAIYSRTNHERDNYTVAFDSDQARASAHRCIELAQKHQARLIYGHDPDQWAELRKAPSIYR
jgi:N-acyl homoserine lactone hydrolase